MDKKRMRQAHPFFLWVSGERGVVSGDTRSVYDNDNDNEKAAELV